MLKKTFKVIKLALGYLGVYPQEFFQNISSLSWYLSDLSRLRSQMGSSASKMGFGVPIAIFKDKADTSGKLSGHYFHQDLLVAQRIFDNQPLKHVDIGSRTDGFVAHVASFREIEVIDIREAEVSIKNMRFIKADFMQIDKSLEDYADSVSCLHVIEHFGLGRYGDPIDVDGHLKGLNNIHKMIKPGGKFYFSTPIGPEKIHFNAHRVFSVTTLLDVFKEHYTIDQFSYVDDKGDLHQNIDPLDGISDSFGCKFGCGIFELTKK